MSLKEECTYQPVSALPATAAPSAVTSTLSSVPEAAGSLTQLEQDDEEVMLANMSQKAQGVNVDGDVEMREEKMNEEDAIAKATAMSMQEE
jgi:hypothetical protein